MQRTESARLFAEALEYIPGGVNSPVRAFRAVGGSPFFVNKASGCRVFDVDGNQYVDYVGTWGPAIHGHAFQPIIDAIQAAAPLGTSFGIPNPREVVMARMIREAVPSVKKVRLCSSGTEATMSAIRLARGFTGRDKFIKFDGCYHGHADCLLVKAGSGALTLGNPDSAGVPASVAQHTLVLPYNDAAAVQKCFETYPGQIAAIIVEPVAGNAGLFLPRPGYLEALSRITREHGALLIFDEVMTGFRLARGGAQERFGIHPDLSCFGKIIGGGLPVGAFGGRAEIMNHLAPLGPVYQAGTLSGNPLAMAAGIASLSALTARTYETLEARGAQLEEGMTEAARNAGVTVRFKRCGSMFCAYFTEADVHDLADAMKSDREKFGRFFRGMLEEGVYLAPSQFEAGFISTTHSPEDIDQTIRAARKVLAAI